MGSTLQEIIPQIIIPYVPDLRPPPSAPSTVRYAPLTAPPRHHVPYWILHTPTLADSMMKRLRTYLTTAPGSNMSPSCQLQQRVDDLPGDLLDTAAGELSNEETTTKLWDSCIFPLIRYAVKEVDQNPTRPTLVVRRTLYSQTPDALICPTSDTSPRLHQEDKSWTVFNTFAPEILALAQHVEDGWVGSSLELRTNEGGARSIVMKMGVSMIGGPNLIPYGILFGGHKFMLFSLFHSVDTLGEVRYGLACSGIIECTSITTPLIPLVIYTLLGNTSSGPVQLCQPTFAIPPVLTPTIQDSKPVTGSRLQNFMSSISPKKAIFHTHFPSGAVSRSFMLYREPNASSVRSIGPLITPFTQPPTAHVRTMVPRIYNLFTMPFHSTLSRTPPNEQIKQAVEDPFATNASLSELPFDQIEISLTECIGHGASGQVFIGTTDDEKYAIKIAPWKSGKQMLRQEADIYNILSDLQGRCIPKIYGFFGSEHLKALIMTYMGHSVENISDLSMDQRHQLLEELCLIHEHGVLHGDLRVPNIVLQNGSAHFIDFSHGYEHQCTGRATCSELIEARQLLLLDLEHPLQTGQ